MKVKKALLSVSDKTGIIDFARALDDLGIEILSTGGTSKVLKDNGIRVKDVSEYTGFPEIMNGRVKTLHPKIHGGILCVRNNDLHIDEAEINSIELIDLVVVNLYPFEEVAAKDESSLDEIIENIDIGGPAMIRSAAKNFNHVIVVTDPNDYGSVLEGISKRGDFPLETRKKLALKAFGLTSNYDFAIEKKLMQLFEDKSIDRIKLFDIKKMGRYAENWHQSGFFAKTTLEDSSGIIGSEKLNGPDLGYNNYLDVSFAYKLTSEFPKDVNCVAIIKHGNPCGLAVGKSMLNSLERAWQGDSISAFGSVISCNNEFNLEMAYAISERINSVGKKGWFVEIISAPEFSKEALDYLRMKKTKKNLRLLKVNKDNMDNSIEYRSISGGIIAQEPDKRLFLTDSIDELFMPSFKKYDEKSGIERVVGIVSDKISEKNSKRLFEFSWIAVKYIHSNAICIAREYSPECFQILGMGSGQPNRKDSTIRLALAKARENLIDEYEFLCGKDKKYLSAILHSEKERLESMKDEVSGMSLNEYIERELSKCVLASDAFFPFEDGIIPALDSGIKRFIQPGGSVGDKRIIDTINRYKAEMIFTGMRHFLH